MVKIEKEILPKYLEKYFWDTDFKKLNKEKDKMYITAKILEYGDIQALRWLFANFSEQEIGEIFAKTRYFSRRAANFWRVFFNLPKNKVLCMNKSFLGKQKEHWPY